MKNIPEAGSICLQPERWGGTYSFRFINPLNAELNPIRHLLAFVEARHIVHVSSIRVKKNRHQSLQILTKLTIAQHILQIFPVTNVFKLGRKSKNVCKEIHLRP